MSADEPLVPVTWTDRDVPLPPRAVAGRGDAARALGRRLLGMERERTESLTLAVHDDVLVVRGPESHLPWADGVTWFGSTEDCPSLLVPTLLAPDRPIALVARALAARHPDDGPHLAWPSESLVLSLAAARPWDPERLSRWIEALP